MTAKHKKLPPDTRTNMEVSDLVRPSDETHAGRTAEEAPWDLPTAGQSVDRYVLEEEIGRGGMGVVYRAFDPELRRYVALKLLRPELVRTSVERFLEEAQVTAQLQHPVILPVYDVGRLPGGGIYYTMQLIYGRTLGQLIGGVPAEEEPRRADLLSRFKLLQVFVTLCRAVAYAHGRGVIHRDLKPSNVMIGPFGEVYVMDWGVAKILSGEPEVEEIEPELGPYPGEPIEVVAARQETTSGLIVGTPAYMAPEQANRDRSVPVGRPADVYCLGGVLYHILTGRPPREGTASEMVHWLSSGAPPPAPGSLHAGIPSQLNELCTRALAADPEDRPISAGALADTVQAYLEGRSLSAATPEEARFLSSYSSLAYRRPSVTSDVVLVLTPEDGPPRVALIYRDHPPYTERWACPGTFVRMEESLEAAAARALREKVGLDEPPPLLQMSAYGDPQRDPRTRVITVAFLARLDARPATRGVSWFEVREDGEALRVTGAAGERIELAFDHAQLIREALRQLER